jgi:hypothetical protein
MLRLLPFFVSMIVFISVGVYLALFTRNFLSWNRRCNEKLHRYVDCRLARPVLEARAQINYAHMETNGGLSVFIWSIRVIGTALILFSIMMIIRMITLI